MHTAYTEKFVFKDKRETEKKIQMLRLFALQSW